jgi:hypothetical protein
MHRFLIVVSLSAALALSGRFALPLSSEPYSPPQEAPQDKGALSLSEMFEQILRGFLSEAEPQLRELERGFSALEPEIQRFLDELRGMTQYHPPEILPNGDILIRRRATTPPQADQSVPRGDEDASPSVPPFEL